ncbi:Protein of unknown function [Gryllus bimaculatus]|nr:Protein of unknown function [Gryllus bimaculatus]
MNRLSASAGAISASRSVLQLRDWRKMLSCDRGNRVYVEYRYFCWRVVDDHPDPKFRGDTHVDSFKVKAVSRQCQAPGCRACTVTHESGSWRFDLWAGPDRQISDKYISKKHRYEDDTTSDKLSTYISHSHELQT